MPKPKHDGKNRVLAILLAIFLGIIGAHKFYLRNWKYGVLYLAFCWTGIPILLGFYDAFKYYQNPDQFGSAPVSAPDSEISDLGGENTNNAGADGRVMVVEGVNGVVTLYDDRLEISREGIGMLHKMQHGFKGNKEIPYESITSIQLRKASSMTRGYIQFGQSGFSESDDGLMDAVSDENTVLFDKDSLHDFEALRAKIRELKKGDVEETTGTMDGAMEKLRERYATGEIDEEEYKTRKEILQEN